MNKKLLKNNKGFSLVELLIVIAIMGVLAVISFNVFNNVLSNSRRKADIQQANSVAKAVLTYCADTEDWDLSEVAHGNDSSTLLALLTDEVTIDGVDYGPYIALHDASGTIADQDNIDALAPQWNTTNGGSNVGWEIVVQTDAQNVTCVPSTAADTVAVN